MDDLSERTGGPRLLSMFWPNGLAGSISFRSTRTDTGSGPRIVRVGTHALSQATLWKRLSQHKGSTNTGGGNHRGSIFRQSLYQHGVREAQRPETSGIKNRNIRDKEQEKQVSQTIGNMPFLWLAISDAPGPDSLRGYIERNAIALLSNDNKPPIDAPSPQWLGYRCNREKVRRSGLWNQNHVDETYAPAFLDMLDKLVAEMTKKR